MKYATKNFKWSELWCKCGCKTTYVDARFLIKLQRLRDMVGPISISSCCRCPIHNARVGGVSLSKHRSTIRKPTTAADVRIGKHNKDYLISCAIKAGFTGIGVNYKTFIHVDTGRKRRW